MQEEVTQKTIALVIKTAKLDANVLKAAMRMYLNHRRQKAQKTHGKTSVKKLVGEGVGVSSIEVTDGNIKSFERVWNMWSHYADTPRDTCFLFYNRRFMRRNTEIWY